LDAKDTLDGGGTESFGDLELDERDDRDLVLAKSIIRRWRRHADRFAKAGEQLEWDPGAIADLPERLGRKVSEPLETGCIEEVERQRITLDGTDHVLERDPGILERLRHLHAPHIARRETVPTLGGQDA
jgi:hypothetical protein